MRKNILFILPARYRWRQIECHKRREKITKYNRRTYRDSVTQSNILFRIVSESNIKKIFFRFLKSSQKGPQHLSIHSANVFLMPFIFLSLNLQIYLKTKYKEKEKKLCLKESTSFFCLCKEHLQKCVCWYQGGNIYRKLAVLLRGSSSFQAVVQFKSIHLFVSLFPSPVYCVSKKYFI